MNPRSPSRTASSGAIAWTRKPDVDSPIAVDSPLITQNAAVISGTRRLPPAVSHEPEWRRLTTHAGTIGVLTVSRSANTELLPPLDRASSRR